MFLRNSSYVPSPPTSYYSFHFISALQGASTTVVGDKVYLYVCSPFHHFPPSFHLTPHPKGGRLVTERRMVTDMYVFDLKTLVWEKVIAPADDCTPAQRYFHSADSCECRFSLFISSHLTIPDREPISHRIWWHGIETGS
jgi:hypothetical protein